MEGLVSWLGLAGVWILLAGSIYQAVLELRAHELAVDRLEAVGAAARTQRVSAWWWLLPPVKILLERQRAMANRHLYMTGLSVDEFESLVSFINKATGWMLVATGGFLIAGKETHQFCHEHHVGHVVFVPLVLGLGGLCIFFIWMRTSSSDQLLAKKRGQPAKGGPAGD